MTSALDWPAGASDDDPGTVVRRAPFADNPFVGERGQRARQRILAAALQVFGEDGYHECGIERITELSGYSRASFYQYFSDKEDVFRQLAGRVARLLADATDGAEPITADAAGRASLRAWLGRYTELYRAFTPVFVTFHSAAASDEAVASGAARVSVRTFSALRSKVDGSPLLSRQVDGVVRALPGVVARVNAMVELLRSVGVTGWLADADRVDDAVADVFHRALFSPAVPVNVRALVGVAEVPKVLRAPPIDPDAELAGDPSLSPSARRTRAQLVEAGHRVFAERGYYATRVLDVVSLAGLSRGSFYRHFDNKTHLFRLVAERASARLATAFAGIPVLAGPDVVDDVGGALRAWLTGYARTTAEEATIIGMWSEAMSRDPDLGPVSAAVTERQRSACAELLEPRRFGDVDAEALVMVMLLDAMTTERPTASRIETAARIIERGLLTPP